MKNLLEVENTKKEMKKHKLEFFVRGTWIGMVEDEDYQYIYEDDFISDDTELFILTDVDSDKYNFDDVKREGKFKKEISIKESTMKKQMGDVKKIFLKDFNRTSVNQGHYGWKWVKEWYQCDIYTDGNFDSSKLKFNFLQVGRSQDNLSIQPYSITYDGKEIELEFSYGDDKGGDIFENWDELRNHFY
jgi:hypothetical protein